jgi:hypothetical protein
MQIIKVVIQLSDLFCWIICISMDFHYLKVASDIISQFYSFAMFVILTQKNYLFLFMIIFWCAVA